MQPHLGLSAGLEGAEHVAADLITVGVAAAQRSTSISSRISRRLRNA